jgi:hypothetical protein
VTSANGMDTVLDWRLVAQPPLLLHNQLPVPGFFSVVERPKAGARSVVRQQVGGARGRPARLPHFGQPKRETAEGASLATCQLCALPDRRGNGAAATRQLLPASQPASQPARLTD